MNKDVCNCGDPTCWNFDAGFKYCRPHRAHHRGGECPINEKGVPVPVWGDPVVDWDYDVGTGWVKVPPPEPTPSYGIYQIHEPTPPQRFRDSHYVDAMKYALAMYLPSADWAANVPTAPRGARLHTHKESDTSSDSVQARNVHMRTDRALPS